MEKILSQEEFKKLSLKEQYILAYKDRSQRWPHTSEDCFDGEWYDDGPDDFCA